jgi:hypothetical protein
MADVSYVDTGIPLRRIANTSNIQPEIFLKKSIHTYKILQLLDMNAFPPNVHIVRRLRYLGEISPELEKPPTRKDTVVSTTSRRILRNAHSVSQCSSGNDTLC